MKLNEATKRVADELAKQAGLTKRSDEERAAERAATKPSKPVKSEDEVRAERNARSLAKAKEGTAKYPHALVETLEWDLLSRKYRVKILCSCGNAERWVFTSDLWQVKSCSLCTKTNRKENKKAKKVAAKANEVY